MSRANGNLGSMGDLGTSFERSVIVDLRRHGFVETLRRAQCTCVVR